MIITAAVIIKMLEKHNIKPIVVGGFSVEIYTQSDYSTRDIDFVSDGLWGFTLLAKKFESVDVPYVVSRLHGKQEKEEFADWLEQISFNE